MNVIRSLIVNGFHIRCADREYDAITLNIYKYKLQIYPIDKIV